MIRLALSALIGSSLLVGAPAWASSWATLDEVPAMGGELRLAVPGEDYDADGQPAIAFPLRHTKVDVRVVGPMAEVTMEQTFDNPYDRPLEAVYAFPMSADAAVNGYEIAIGERIIAGTIATREEARAQYEEARAAGHTAGLLEMQKPNVFLQSIANIAPGETIRVRLTYVELLAYDLDTGYRFVFPMTITPRYLPEDHAEPRPVSGGGGSADGVEVPYVAAGRSGHDVDVDVVIEAGVPIEGLVSPSHAIEQAVGETEATVGLVAESTIPNRDFVLDFRTAGERTLATLLTHHDEALGGFFTLIVQPKAGYVEADIRPREVVVVVDVSGSMAGEPLARAKYVARGIIEALGPRDTLNVVTFSDRAEHWRAEPAPSSEAARQDALAFVDGLVAAGGTVMDAGLREALADPTDEGALRFVYLLTDGGIGNDDQILALVQGAQGANRVFPVGVSAAPNRYLLDQMAVVGRGFATHIGLTEDPAPARDRLLERSTWPYLTDLAVDWDGLDIHSLAPARMADVYAGRPLVMAGRYDAGGSGEIRINGRRGGAPFELPVKVTLARDVAARPVAYAWATRRVHELLASQFTGERPEVVDEVTAIGLTFAMVTPYTSFIAVDDGRVVEGGSLTVEQPNEVPSGYGGGSTSSGGYDDGYGDGGPLLVLFGGLLALSWRRRRRA